MNIKTCSSMESYQETILNAKVTGMADVTSMVGYVQAVDTLAKSTEGARYRTKLLPLGQMLDDFYNARTTTIVELESPDYEYQVAFLSPLDADAVNNIFNFRLPNEIIKRVSEVVA